MSDKKFNREAHEGRKENALNLALCAVGPASDLDQQTDLKKVLLEV
jgi:hypothetical protein